jgi:GrpB-like predicted nucleotidyltransferase (UPF0157 family)
MLQRTEEPFMPNPVVIAAYDPRWPELFSELGAALRQALSETALRIDHIGSTAVPGLDAKPVIDVQISVVSFEPLDAYRIPIESLGFVFRANNPDLTKRYFRETPGERRTHIHVRRAGSWAEQSALLFRDYVRTHEGDARRYAELKYRLAEKYRDDRLSYTDGKGPFVREIMVRAADWSQESGWEPGPTDA